MPILDPGICVIQVVVGEMCGSFVGYEELCNWIKTSCNIHFKRLYRFPLENSVTQGTGVRNIQPCKCEKWCILS